MANQGPRARRWAFTIFQGNLKEHSTLIEWENAAKVRTYNGVRYMVFQREVATTTQTEHVQGYIHFTGQKYSHQVNSILHTKNTHFEVANGNPADNRAYCTEGEKRVKGAEVFEYGEIPGNQGSKLQIVAATIKEHGLKRAIEESPQTYITNGRGMRDLDRFYKRAKVENRISRDLCVYVVYGPSGSGKSHFAEHFDPGHTYPFPDINRRERLNIDNYNDERTIVIEDYDGAISFRTLLRILDIYNVELNTKGDFAPVNWSHVLITANNHPTTWYGNDVDSWGDVVSPLQRRIHYLIEAKGVYPNVEYIWNGEESTDHLPTLLETQQVAADKIQQEVAEEVDAIIEDLEQQDIADEAEGNDCMPSDFVPTNTTYDGDNEDMGEAEPIGEDLFGQGADVW